MNNSDYHKSIAAEISSREAFDGIARVSEWWTKSFKGDTRKTGDIFSVSFGETFVIFEVAEVVPDKKIVWEVTDCNLHWIQSKKEWKGTKILWEITAGNGEVSVTMTHVGLVPGIECYDNCRTGWDFYIEKSLLNLLTDNKGLADQG